MDFTRIQHRFQLSTLNERAFAALLATMFSIAFSIALGQIFAGVCFLFFGMALYKGQIRLCVPRVMGVALAFIVLAVALSWWHGGAEGLWSRCGKLMWFLLIPVTASLVVVPGRDRTVVLAFLAGSAVLGLKDLLLYPFLAWRKPVPDYLTSLIDKGSMTDGQMLMLGVVGSVLILLATLRAGRRVPWWLWAMLVAQAAGLLINFKRGSWLCTIILIGVILLIHVRWKVWLLAVVLLVGFFALPPVQARMGTLKKEFNVEGGGRLTMWFKIAPALVHDHPEGIGYRRLTNGMMRDIFRKVEPNRNHLHANWAQRLVETGWVGLGIYLTWMMKTLADGIAWVRRRRDSAWEDRAVACASVFLVIGLLLNGLVEYNFGDTEIMFVYAFLMGLAGACRSAGILGARE